MVKDYDTSCGIWGVRCVRPVPARRDVGGDVAGNATGLELFIATPTPISFINAINGGRPFINACALVADIP